MMFLIREDDGGWDWIHTINPDLDGMAGATARMNLDFRTLQ